MTWWIQETQRLGGSNLNCTCSCMFVQRMIYHPWTGAIEMRTLVALLQQEGEGGVVWEQFKQCPPVLLTNLKCTRVLFALGSCACKISLGSAALGWGANVLRRLVPATYRCSGACKKKQHSFKDTWTYIHIYIYAHSFFWMEAVCNTCPYNMSTGSPLGQNASLNR